MPTMNTCHTVGLAGVSTSNLSGPCVNILPKYVSREIVNGALKVVQMISDTYTEDLRRMLKGKSLAEHIDPTPPKPPRQQPPRFIPPENLSVDELKSLLFAKLLSQAEEGEVEVDLIHLLRAQTKKQAAQVSRAEFDELKSDVKKLMDMVSNSIITPRRSINKLSIEDSRVSLQGSGWYVQQKKA